jgi:hypothetical protein
VLLAVLVALPSLAGGLAVDDHWHKIMLSHDPAWRSVTKSWYELFTFYDGDPERTHRILDIGLSPWWTDPELRLAFFRPVTAATHAADYALWPTHPWIMHVHSMVWFAALVAVAGWTYRRLLPGWAGSLAGLLYALDHNHGIPVAWIANRNSLVAGVFAIAALGAHDVAVREKRAAARWTLGSALLLALALASGESALAVGGYLVAYALFLDERPWADKVVSRRTRWSLPCGRPRIASAASARTGRGCTWSQPVTRSRSPRRWRGTCRCSSRPSSARRCPISTRSCRSP